MIITPKMLTVILNAIKYGDHIFPGVWVLNQDPYKIQAWREDLSSKLAMASVSFPVPFSVLGLVASRHLLGESGPWRRSRESTILG